MPLYRRLAARSHSHAGCALGGDRLAMSVCGQTPFRDRLSVTTNRRLQTDFSRHRPLVFSARASVSSVFSVSAHHPLTPACHDPQPRQLRRSPPRADSSFHLSSFITHHSFPSPFPPFQPTTPYAKYAVNLPCLRARRQPPRAAHPADVDFAKNLLAIHAFAC